MKYDEIPCTSQLNLYSCWLMCDLHGSGLISFFNGIFPGLSEKIHASCLGMSHHPPKMAVGFFAIWIHLVISRSRKSTMFNFGSSLSDPESAMASAILRLGQGSPKGWKKYLTRKPLDYNIATQNNSYRNQLL
jgi:hypothetical protein